MKDFNLDTYKVDTHTYTRTGEFNMSLPYKTNNINADEFNQDLNMNKYFNNMIVNDQFIEAKVNILKDPTKTPKEKLFNLKVSDRQEVKKTGYFQ